MTVSDAEKEGTQRGGELRPFLSVSSCPRASREVGTDLSLLSLLLEVTTLKDPLPLDLPPHLSVLLPFFPFILLLVLVLAFVVEVVLRVRERSQACCL